MKQKNYPLYQTEPFTSFKEMIADAAQKAGDKIAFKFKKDKEIKEITYRQFKTEVDILGTALSKIGVSGKHIAMVAENSYRWINVFLSVLCGKGTYVPMDKELPIDDIIHVLNESDSEVVFCSRAFEQPLKDRIEKLPKVTHFITFDTEDELSPVEGQTFSYQNEKFLTMRNLFDLGREALAAGYAEFFKETNEDDDLKMLVYTSGTTGLAKGVMLSNQNLISCVYYGLQVSRVYDVCLSVLPMHHTYESVCGILVSLHEHATICVNENLRAVSENLKLFRPDYIMLVPRFVDAIYKKVWQEAERTGKAKILKAMIKTSNALRKTGIDLRKKMFGSVRQAFGGNIIKIVCGGAPLRPELGDFFEAIGITLINGYGITECSPLVSANRDFFNDCRTVGLPLPCIELKIHEPDEEGAGEICVKGKTVMLGYYKNPEATGEVLSDGWFYTGDYGKINEKEQLIITGRKKNLIVLSNGKNIYPEEIENYIESIPLIEEVVVYALPDQDGDESRLCAEVFLNQSKVKEGNLDTKELIIKTVTEEVKNACAGLPKYKQIRKIIIRETEFEKTTTKKIKRGTIRHG